MFLTINSIFCMKFVQYNEYLVRTEGTGGLVFYTSPPGATHMHQWTGPSLVQIIAWRRTGDKPLPEPMLVYRQLDHWEQVSVKIKSEFYNFHSRKCIWKCHLPKWQPFCPGGDELSTKAIGATVLSTNPCVSSVLWVKECCNIFQLFIDHI